ncbi:NADH-quinone oxidoreductase subunit 5 family protein [Actinoallomurus soli]|uniref:NADH-quinone oxidoreductase subunit 5 family protein n=1 Tax=Actinoallomurus soli TaxID=2952535 RepID=UPI002092741B|nr:NADH-quinone oxidoreductase subunit L [Actinoallomurus soli]MCO5967934.1 NADH-quinone oxidoreductase subunit L [Actinoallomurus soli]
MIVVAAVAVVLPFAAALVGMLFGHTVSHLLSPLARRVRKPAPGTARRGALVLARRMPANGPALIAVVPVAVSTVLTAVLAVDQLRHPASHVGTLTRVPTGTVEITLSLQVDGLASVVALLVCCVALAVQIYSVAYMRDDPRYSSYAAFVSLFTAAMLLVVLSGDLLVLYVGWEVMGICSYFLIGHYWHDRATSRAAVKAFLVTRLGDVGFLFGIFVLGLAAHSFQIREIIGRVGVMPHTALLAGTLLLLCGVAGKSAQFPLHTWLPDAMAGPTPISALIHAATMVAAGVYVVARLYPAFFFAPASLAVLGVIAAISMLGAALAALAQEDLKRVLAYSTISQLAYMAAGLAVGARDGAVFHLLAHGAFKALLFLGAGCVIVTVGSNLMSAMGGLRLAMPVTFWSMTVGFAALAGIPPASGFFSKDTILSQAWKAAHDRGTPSAGGWYASTPLTTRPAPQGQAVVLTWTVKPRHMMGAPVPHIPSWVAWLVLVTGLLTVVITAAYATRTWLVTFFGERRSAVRAREATPLMRWPVAALAVPALILGFFGLGSAELRPEWGMAVISLLCAAAGAGGVYVVWNNDPALDPVRLLGPLRPVLRAAFYLDTVYDVTIVRPVRALARLVVHADERVVDAGVEGSGRGARRLGGLLRATENGNAQAYVSGLFAGVVLIVVAVVVLT